MNAIITSLTLPVSASDQPSMTTANNHRLAHYADVVLAKLSQLYRLPDDTDSSALQHDLCTAIQTFELQAKLGGVPALKVLTARYILCAVLDEAILQSNWGQYNHWAERCLLSLFHNDTWGGEQFFALVQKALQEPKFNIDLLELMYICLALGFEGQYRIQPDGMAQLQRLRQELWHLLQLYYPTQKLGLLKPQAAKKFSRHWWIKWGAVGVGCCALTVAVYVFFYQTLLSRTLEVTHQIVATLN